MQSQSRPLNHRFVVFEAVVLALILILTGAVSRLKADTGTCSGNTITLPFNDVMGNSLFCFIAEVYFLGITAGCGNGTAYCPNETVTRAAMAVFLDRTHDSALKRGSRRAALDQFWTTQGGASLGLTTVGDYPQLVKSDGVDLWVANSHSGTVSRVRASDGKKLEEWTGASGAFGVLVAMGKVFITGSHFLYQIDPQGPCCAVTTVTDQLSVFSQGVAFDGARIWVASIGDPKPEINSPPSVSIVTLNPVSVTTVRTGFSQPAGLVYDGANMWLTDQGDFSLKKLDSNGNVLFSIQRGAGYPAFDGTNIWVPNGTNAVVVVRASATDPTKAVLATLTANGLQSATQAAFDGQRVLVTGEINSTVSLWRAADFAPLGTFVISTGSSAFGACSDGINFWITLHSTNQLVRF